LLLPRAPRLSLFEGESEYRYFDFFVSQPVGCLNGYFRDATCTDTWNFAERFMLQACHKEEFVRHGIIAIAAFKKTLETSSFSGTLARDNGLQ
jgi:hypothetical protein